MDEEMSALTSWDLVTTPPLADVVACRWVFTLKYRADGIINCCKAHLVAKGYAQVPNLSC